MLLKKRIFPDTLLLVTVGGLVVFGLLAFFSSSLGIVAREGQTVSSIIANQIFFGLGLGIIAFFICTALPYKTWRPFAFYIYGGTLALTALVFFPGLGLEHGGSERWINLGFISFQPSEPLKVALVMALAAYFATYRNQLESWRYGFGGLILFISFPAALLLLQPDHGTLGVILLTAGVMFVAANAPMKQVITLILVGVLAGALAISSQEYTRERVMTFFNPEREPSGASYQVRQSILALGSGEATGRGLGRSIQKFRYLPEPVGDSIFAVIGEEFGFIGTTAIVVLFSTFMLRGFFIATRSQDFFGGLLAVGIVTYITSQSLLNMAAMLGLVPLTGIPLIFISQGGTAMFTALGSVGILASISRHARRG